MLDIKAAMPGGDYPESLKKIARHRPMTKDRDFCDKLRTIVISLVY
ncbi:MAG: hypothetical protein PHP70_05230 [Gallionella sp.]|nr:hypothetical protein [Gallionella sp.]